MADQPHYHTAGVLFTSTRPVSRDALTSVLRTALRAKARSEVVAALKAHGILPDSIECESIDHEPGDPADL